MLTARVLSCCALLSLATWRAVAAQTPCATPTGAVGPSRDLYCIELFPGAGADSAAGTVQLDWAGGPFTVSVEPDGTHRWAMTFALRGMPDSLLRPGGAFVAWAAPPTMYPLVRLGVVHNGVTHAGMVALNRFVVLVSAEPDSAATDRHGRIVLRGEAAGMRLRPADVYQFVLGGIPQDGGRQTVDGGMAGMHHGVMRPADSLGWTDVPMIPGLDMLPSEMALRPNERAWLPPDDPHAPAARPRQVLRLRTGDTIDLTAGVVRRSIAGRSFTMYGFNGQYPGPLLMVAQQARVTVRFANRLPQPSSVHWHGVRLDNRFDGAVGLTQPEVPPGGSFTYQLVFPDAGIYWYHPHVREDAQQDLGLYGNIFVRSSRPDAYEPAHREEFLILDDILINDAGLVPYGADSPTHAAMGRFGNVFLLNGEPRWNVSARRGEVVRLFLTNASGTRTFNLSFGDSARMKLVGSDLGNYDHETWVRSVVIGPAERYIVDVRFEKSGNVALLNRVQGLDHLYGRFVPMTDTLGVVTVGRAAASPDLARAFERLRTDSVALREHAVVRAATPASSRTLELRVAFTGLPFVSDRLMRVDSIYFNPVEWAGTMPGMNWSTTGAMAHWTIRDPDSRAENMDIRWSFRRGDVVRLTLVAARDVLHGMQHPIHIHGQRFVVLAVNGVPNQNQVWKDTALVPAGSTVELLVEMSNPGRWMVHCHIAEHLASGMMTAFDVEDH